MPRTVTIEQHAVFATLADNRNQRFRVSDWGDWHETMDLFNAMDDQRFESLQAKGLIAYKGLRIKYYGVRSENDPAYAHLPFLDLARGFVVYSREYPTERAAAKAVLEPLGYYAKAGGWIYYRDGRQVERVLAHGWWTAAQATGHFVSRLQGERGYRAAVTTALLVKKEN